MNLGVGAAVELAHREGAEGLDEVACRLALGLFGLVEHGRGAGALTVDP